MKKILHVVGGINLGGTETYLMNIYRTLNRDKTQFGFLTYYTNNEDGFYDKEIIKLGGEIHNIKPVSLLRIYSFIAAIRKILREGEYQVIHTHTTHNMGFALLAAKLENIEIRIAHSHNTLVGKKATAFHKIYRKVMYELINRFANCFCACSLKAGEHMFTPFNIQNEYHYLPNAVDLNQFLTDNNYIVNYKLKESLEIPPDAKVIGHVGRYGKAKNHEFIISMFFELSKKREDIYLILVGEGSSRKQIELEIERLGISKKVKVLGLRYDIANLMKIMDVFILPSLYEGFGIVLLEAQASGLPCVVSENIQPEPDMNLGLLHWAPLSCKDTWINKIEENLDRKILDNKKIITAVKNSPFQLEHVTNQFHNLYSKSIK